MRSPAQPALAVESTISNLAMACLSRRQAERRSDAIRACPANPGVRVLEHRTPWCHDEREPTGANRKLRQGSAYDADSSDMQVGAAPGAYEPSTSDRVEGRKPMPGWRNT